MPELTNWLMDIGISEDILLVLTFVPIIVTITTASRYISGLKTFGVYTSMILAFAYYFIGAKQGLIITIIVVASSWLIRNMLRKVRLHYLSRLSVVYCGISIILLSFIAATSFIPSDSPIMDFRNLSPIPLVMIISITDRFMANYIKKDLLVAARLTAETIFISVIGWTLMRVEPIQKFFYNNLWLIPLTIIINLSIGKYSGFRWTEYIRFSQVIKNVESPEDRKQK
ncbi:MAG: 7TM domain-containing protein [Patescibacteria group bacterium]|nr:7TM domain-containing protein [Patescibacteria group bacterium]